MAVAINHATGARHGRARRASASVPAGLTSRKSTAGGHYVGSRYAPNSLSKDADEKCTEAFSLLDVDQSGRIDAVELGRAFRLLDIELPRTAQDRIIRAMLMYLDKNTDDEISLSEFKTLWGAYVGWKKKKDREAPRPPFFPPVTGKKKIPLSIFLIFDDPSSCMMAKITSLIIIVTIILSTTTFVLETDPAFRKWESGRPGLGVEVGPPVFGTIELVSIVLFSTEYLIRAGLVGFAPPDDASPVSKVCSFFLHPMNMIDLLAIMPYYIELMVPPNGNGGGSDAFGVLRILRVARVFRVFKLGKYSSGLQMFARVILESVSALMLLMFFLLIAVILFGALVYHAEKGAWSNELGGFARLDVTGQKLELTPFTSIPASFWWVLTTSTTVGYGDMFPTSFFGKVVGLITMLMGILALALPVTIIGSNFSRVHADMRDKQIESDQRGLIDMWLTLSSERKNMVMTGVVGEGKSGVDGADGSKYSVVAMAVGGDGNSSSGNSGVRSDSSSGGKRGSGGGKEGVDDVLSQLAEEIARMKERFARIESLLAKAKKEE
jgi:hypothetical protein